MARSASLTSYADKLNGLVFKLPGASRRIQPEVPSLSKLSLGETGRLPIEKAGCRLRSEAFSKLWREANVAGETPEDAVSSRSRH